MSDLANVFISHRHEDDEKLQAMSSLVGDNGFTIRDSSINSAKPNQANERDYIKFQVLAPRIQWAGVLVVLISPDTRNHEWVDWEIEYAHSLGKRIIGVWTHGSAECDLPEPLERYADAVVGWQADRIILAITGDLNNWECSDGTPREPYHLERVKSC